MCKQLAIRESRKMKRNYCIDFIKILLAVFIALGHFGVQIVSSGMIVICFFIISGYFLVKSFESGKYHEDSLEYTQSRVRRIYPYYAFALLMMIFYEIIVAMINGTGKERILNIGTTILPESFLVQNIGVYDGGINYPLWQLCTLIVASHIIFALLCYNEKLTQNVICPLIAIAGASYFSNAFGTHEVESWKLINSFISAPLLKAFTGVSIGVALYEIINKCVEKLKTINSIWISVIFGYAVWYYGMNNASYQCILAFVVILICVMCPKGIQNTLFNHAVFSKCEKLSLVIYVSQALIINIVNRWIVHRSVLEKYSVGIYLVVLIVYSVVFIKIVEKLQKRFSKQE